MESCWVGPAWTAAASTCTRTCWPHGWAGVTRASATLKLAQRTTLDQGITVMRWTFDRSSRRTRGSTSASSVRSPGVRASLLRRDGRRDQRRRAERPSRRWDLDGPGPWRGSVTVDAKVVLRAEARPRILSSTSTASGDAALLEIRANTATSALPIPNSVGRGATRSRCGRVCLGRGLVGVAFLREPSAYVFVRADGASSCHRIDLRIVELPLPALPDLVRDLEREGVRPRPGRWTRARGGRVRGRQHLPRLLGEWTEVPGSCSGTLGPALLAEPDVSAETMRTPSASSGNLRWRKPR
jgi:hypothetical protein